VLHSGIVGFITMQFEILLCLSWESATLFSVIWFTNKKNCKNSLSFDSKLHKTTKPCAWWRLKWYL